MSDVHAAAERKIAKQLIDDCVADVVDRFSGHTRARMSTRHEDAVRACIAAHVHGAFAALHPADDGEPVTEEFAELHGLLPTTIYRRMEMKGQFGILVLCFEPENPRFGVCREWASSSVNWLCDVTTRGQLRRLLAALA